MVGEACLSNNAYFLWTPDYTPFILGPCLSELSLFCLSVYRLYDFLEYDFGMFTSDSFIIDFFSDGRGAFVSY